jgi:hypothetical protein
MGQGAKKKRAAEARAAKKLKATQLEDSDAPASASTDHDRDPTLSDAPTRSKTRNSKTVPRVPSVSSSEQSVPTRQSTRLLGSSSTFGSVKKHSSVNLEGNGNGKTRPQRSATAAAMTLLQELQLSETKEPEHDQGVFTGNDEIIELDEEEDDETGDDGSEMEVIEEPVTRKSKSLGANLKASAVRKKPNLQAIGEEESSSDEFGEYIFLL